MRYIVAFLLVASLCWVVIRTIKSDDHHSVVVAPSSIPAELRLAQSSSPTVIVAALKVADLSDAHAKEIAMELVASAENSTLDWKNQYGFIEDIGDGRGYTGGIIGFSSGTGDMLDVVKAYTKAAPRNRLARYLPALETLAASGSDAHAGLDGFVSDWRSTADDIQFRAAQNSIRDTEYFNPALLQAKADGLHMLGQFAYFDAIVMHGPGADAASFGGIRSTAIKHARTPAQGGSETVYLQAFLAARKAVMRQESAHTDTSRIDTMQARFVASGNLTLMPPLSWTVYGDKFTIR